MLADQEKLVLQNMGTVKNDEGTVQYDQVQLDFCHITAPISGRVGLRLVDPGNVVQSAGTTTLAVITQMEPITVIFTIPEDSWTSASPCATGRQTARGAFDRNNQKKIATGTLLTLDNQIDTTTGTVKGRATFDNKNDVLFPNQFVNTRLLVNTLQGVTLVPASAIQHNGQAAFVYLIQQNVAHLRNVKTGVTDNGITQVDGINPGDVVANSSFDKLQDNSKVTVSSTAPPPSSRGATRREPVSPVYPAARCHLTHHGGYSPGRYGRLLATACLGSASGGLSHHSGSHVLSRSEPHVMATTVTAPLERQFGELQGLSQMTSTSAGGTLGHRPAVQSHLTDRYRRRGSAVRHQRIPELFAFDSSRAAHLQQDESCRCPGPYAWHTSSSMPLSQVEDLVDTRLAPKISQLNGVGLVSISGGQKPAVRIQANPTALSSYGINLEDLRTALTQSSVNAAKGNFDGPARITRSTRTINSSRATTIATWWSLTATGRR